MPPRLRAPPANLGQRRAASIRGSRKKGALQVERPEVCPRQGDLPAKAVQLQRRVGTAQRGGGGEGGLQTDRSAYAYSGPRFPESSGRHYAPQFFPPVHVVMGGGVGAGWTGRIGLHSYKTRRRARTSDGPALGNTPAVTYKQCVTSGRGSGGRRRGGGKGRRWRERDIRPDQPQDARCTTSHVVRTTQKHIWGAATEFVRKFITGRFLTLVGELTP